MAKIIVENREFKDPSTGAIVEYQYYAIRGTGSDSHKYEVQLKNLVQSEKIALEMMAEKENAVDGEVHTRSASKDEKPSIERSDNLLDDDETISDKGMFD